MTPHIQILKRNGKNEFAILPYQEFLKMQESLEDYEDLKELRLAKAKEANAKTVSFKEVKKKLKLN
ncbi:MAG: type II toxin-antitoxin system Phd/YefM family antitoxin [Candidatus Ratteibacteria bacterium]|nr:type II toxin-antitoxin system Phd/YefM family antitoxin [Candidatus Ratteibacteria bacterium]